MKAEKLVPRIRFKGFSNPWEQRKLRDVLVIHSGKDYKHLNVGNVPVYGTGGYMLSVDDKLSDVDAIGIGRKGTIDRPQLLKAPFWTVDTLFFMTRKSNNNLLFLFYLVQSIEWKKYDESTGVPSLSKKSIEKIHICVPEFNEQMVIGKTLFRIDKNIAANEEEVSKLKTFKKLLMQRLFNQNWRFKGYTDPWEQRKLGELFTERNERSQTGELLSVTINSGIVKFNSLARKDNSSSDKSNYKVVKKNDIAYNSMRMWQGASGVSAYEGIVSPAYTVITPKSGNNTNFFGFFFKRVKMLQIFQKNSQGLTSDTWNLKFPALKTIRIMVPQLSEQDRIFKILDKLDKNIAANEEKCKQLKQLKKYLMQNMFV